MNKTMLAKTSWRMLQHDEGLWCNLIREKYVKNSCFLSESYKKPHACSSTWSSVCFGASLFRQGLVWRIGNGEDVHFWTDRWLDGDLLVDKALDPSVVDVDLLVQDFWLDMEWDAFLLYACLPPDIVEKILCIPISNCHQKDKLIWKHTSNGAFSVKSAYMSTIDLS